LENPPLHPFTANQALGRREKRSAIPFPTDDVTRDTFTGPYPTWSAPI
jgi:hypothetical protein